MRTVELYTQLMRAGFLSPGIYIYTIIICSAIFTILPGHAGINKRIRASLLYTCKIMKHLTSAVMSLRMCIMIAATILITFSCSNNAAEQDSSLLHQQLQLPSPATGLQFR